MAPVGGTGASTPTTALENISSRRRPPSGMRASAHWAASRAVRHFWALSCASAGEARRRTTSTMFRCSMLAERSSRTRVRSGIMRRPVNCLGGGGISVCVSASADDSSSRSSFLSAWADCAAACADWVCRCKADSAALRPPWAVRNACAACAVWASASVSRRRHSASSSWARCRAACACQTCAAKSSEAGACRTNISSITAAPKPQQSTSSSAKGCPGGPGRRTRLAPPPAPRLHRCAAPIRPRGPAAGPRRTAGRPPPVARRVLATPGRTASPPS